MAKAQFDPQGKVVVVALGGTIAMVPGQAPGAVPKLSAEDLISAVPDLQHHPIEALSFLQKPSAHLTFDDLDELVLEVADLCQRGATGVVITQGTDTIEEVAFYLDLLLDVEQPVAVTGAMRNPSIAGADGPANLLAAVQVARSPAARKLGVLVVFNDEIHGAQFVTKSHTTNVAAFVSPNAGKIGWLSEGQVIVTTSPRPTPKVRRSMTTRSVSVPILPMTIDFDPEVLRALAGSKIDGLVIDAVGGGHCPMPAADELRVLAPRLPILLSSRSGSGQVLRTTYGFAGGEIDLLNAGLIDTGWLDGRKGRILLSAALRHGMPVTEALSLFRHFRA